MKSSTGRDRNEGGRDLTLFRFLGSTVSRMDPQEVRTDMRGWEKRGKVHTDA